MVDRGWQRRKKRAGKISPQAIYEQDLDLQQSRVPEVTITVVKGPGNTRSTSPPDGKNKQQTPTRSSRNQSTPIQFMKYEPPKPKEKRQQGPKGHSRNGCAAARMSSRDAALVEPENIRTDLVDFKQSLPGTATALYSVIDPEVSSFQEFLSYCKCLLGRVLWEDTPC